MDNTVAVSARSELFGLLLHQKPVPPVRLDPDGQSERAANGRTNHRFSFVRSNLDQVSGVASASAIIGNKKIALAIESQFLRIIQSSDICALYAVRSNFCD